MLKEQEDTLRYASAIERQFFKVLQTPTQMFKIGFSMFISQGISSALISFQIIFQALESEIFWLNFQKSRNLIFRFLFWSHFNLLPRFTKSWLWLWQIRLLNKSSERSIYFQQNQVHMWLWKITKSTWPFLFPIITFQVIFFKWQKNA